MTPDSSPSQAPLVAAAASGASTAPRFGALSHPASWRFPGLAVAQRPRAARVALGLVLLGAFLVILYATGSQNVLVPRGDRVLPPWDSGPLHVLTRYLPVNQTAISIGFSCILLIMLGAWGVLLVGVRTLPLRLIVAVILAVHALVLLSPPLQLNDVFNYLGYAHLGGLHHLNPYTHGIAAEIHDPVYRFSSWHNLPSPYGPLFTALTYPLALLPLSLAFWILKVLTLLMSLALIALVYRCAIQLGRDPRYAVVFLALNPIYVMFAMGGFHNDFYLLVPSLAAVSLFLARRDRSAAAVLMVAVAVKFTAVLLLPFLFIAARQARRRRELAIGTVLGALPMIALDLALFGPHLPNLADQSTLLTNFSIPQLFGLLIGIGGGAPGLLRVANVLLVLSVAGLLRRRGDWLSHAGWATLALIASLAWLMPWYAIWLLPLAGLGTSLRLRRAAVALTVFLVITFAPITSRILFHNGINPLNTHVGRASLALQKKLEE